MIESYAAALYASGILDSAAAVLQQRLAGDADDLQALNTLAQIHRKQGRLAEAAEVFGRIARLAPADQSACYLKAVLGGGIPPAWDAGAQPVPFVLVPRFLPPVFHHTLLPRVLAAPDDDIQASTVGRDTYKPESRMSLTVEGLEDIKLAFWERMMAALPSMLPRLQLEPFVIGPREIRIRTYRAAHFFEVHRDTSIPETVDRQASFVYFFHRTPRRYRGGDLLLFDTNATRFSVTSFTRIVPVDNTLVVFPSRFYHAVVPVESPSGDPGDSRFVINGHIRRDPRTADPASVS